MSLVNECDHQSSSREAVLSTYLPWVILFVSWLLKVEKMHSPAVRVRVSSSCGHLFFLYLGGVFLLPWLLPPPVSSVLCDSDS